MYYSNQIIYDKDKKKLVQLKGDTAFFWGKMPKNNTHLVWTRGPYNGRIYVAEGGLAHAKDLLKSGEIKPSKH